MTESIGSVAMELSTKVPEKRGKRFGQTSPPLHVTIRQILERYPDGQIFKEMIQNADDAGATIVQFYVDCRQHGSKGLVKPELTHYQGPALISANDAMFSDQDWEGIQSLQQSIKADDPFKVGRFGIGFNSVYHLTDIPSILSGDKICFLDPRKEVWKGESGQLFSLKELSCSDHMTPLEGVADFSQSTGFYNKTLFRLPLRNTASDLSKNTYTVEKVNELIEALKSEAHFILLFLRSVHTIEVYNIDRYGAQALSFQTKISDAYVTEFAQKRALLLEKLKSKHTCNAYELSEFIAFTQRFDVCSYDASKGEQESTSHWLVSSRIDSSDADVREASAQQKVFPWVGAAVQLDNPGNGRIFCVLPMPMETASNLPVHVNGTFGVSDDRRSLKWPGVERKNDPTAAWNELLVKRVLPHCYATLLLEAKSHLDALLYYKTWPNVESLVGTNWDSILVPVFGVILKEATIASLRGDEWVPPSSAVFLPQHNQTQPPDVVKRFLLGCGVKLCGVPGSVWDAFEHVKLSVTAVSPKLIRRYLHEYPTTYVSFSSADKHSLLLYCLSDKNYGEDLCGLQLLPLCNGNFVAFEGIIDSASPVYLCTPEFPKNLLPNLDHKLADETDPEVKDSLFMVARSKCTQLKEIAIEDMPSLIDEAMPSEWKKLSSVFFPANKSNFPINWFELFWKWVQNCSLELFADKFVLPVLVQNKPSHEFFDVVKLTSKPILYVPNSHACDSSIRSALSKLKISICLQSEFEFVAHAEMDKFTSSLDSQGVSKALSFNRSLSVASFTAEEAASLRKVLHDSKAANVLTELKIFSVQRVHNQLYSVKDVCQHSLLKSAIAVKFEFFSISVLPANVILFSLGEHYQEQLLQMLKVPFLDEATFLVEYIIPCISNRTIPEQYTDSIMVEVLKHFNAFLPRAANLTKTVAEICFVKVSSSGARKCPGDIFDPDISELQEIFCEEDVFPATPYNLPVYIQALRKCGLRTSVSSQEILNAVYRLSSSTADLTAPQLAGNIQLTRARAILKYIGKSEFKSQCSSVCSMPDNQSREHIFTKAIKIASHSRNWLPVRSSRPSGYSNQLPWKGEEFASHLCSLNSTVSISSTSKPSYALLYGSQMYFTEPVIESGVLTSEESPAHLVAHLQVLISQAHSFTPEDMMEILHKMYSTMSQISHTDLSSLSTIEKWVYIKSSHAFVSPSTVAIAHNSSFRHNLEPYLHTLPDSLSSYSQLFTSFGVSSVFTEEQILSIMTAMKKDINHSSMSISAEDSWRIVMAILNWLTENGTKNYSGSLEKVFVPVESDSEWPDLCQATDVTFTDNDFLKKFSLSSESEKPLVFIHDRVGIKIAERLQLVPLSQELDIAADTFEDTGQYEPLTTRLKNILRDYKDGLTIVKELIQNADDAEATEVNICYDTRTHSKEKDKLFFAGMAESHGPALVIHNNKVFSDEDFDNITKLAGGTKQSKRLKIGKFGIGFCSVYHITDIPSFLSRDRLCIFDPTLAHLGKEIKNPALPGKRLKFNSKYIQNSKQLEPYKNLFGFNGRESYQGTMFRLPFRTAPSELSGKCYSEKTALELLDDIYSCSQNLILFLQHVQTITFQRIDTGDTHPTTLCTVKREEISLPPSVHLNCTSALAINSSKQGENKSSKWLVSKHTTTHSEKDAVANVACQVNSESDGSYTLNSSLNGEIFCYLPLAQSTGLPVHVSCNFAVINNRRGIWTADESTPGDEDEVEWNNFLMENVIPQAYFFLLCCLKSMQQNDIVIGYNFFELWPLTSELKQHNPWSKFVINLYKELEKSCLIFSHSRGDWRSIANSKFLQPCILSKKETPSCVFEVLYFCKYPIVDLPSQYRTHLTLGNSLVSELCFIELFFANLPHLVSLCSSRNSVVQHMLELYSLESDSKSEACVTLHQHFSTSACIPCSPEGETLKRVNDLIHPEAPFAKLYDLDEAMFPLEDLVSKNLPELALKKLGIISEKIPWKYIVERACTVHTLFNSDSTKSYSRVKFILEAITSHTTGQPPSEVNLDSIKFLPVMKKPSDFPLRWPGERADFGCGKQMVRAGPKSKLPNVSIAGSQVVFVSEAQPQDGGCSHISDKAEAVLGLSSKPPPSSVLAHFALVIKNAETLSSEWVRKTCEQVYEYLEKILKSKKVICDFTPLEELPCLWTGSEFIFAHQVSWNWPINGPYLYHVPNMLRNKPALCSQLDIKENFSIHDIKQGLTKMEKDFSGISIHSRSQTVFKQILPLLLHDVEFKDGGFFLPDEKFVLHLAENLAYNDAPWAPQDNTYTYVHDIIPRKLARKIGVQPVRTRFLEKYSSIRGFQGGVAFGQHEELTRRIQNILRDYPLDVTLLKELLQNADDAKATKMYVILDKRNHGKTSILSDEWQDLQGPALLVWNDSVFSERDLEGIQKLGLGSKRSEAETIGQFGIGFNVVYHITDCPSFVTNDETLCIMDPHCRYVPGADVLHPGRRFDKLNQGFWNDFPDIKSAYLRKGIDNLPQEVLGGSLFRFPIRHENRKIAHSEITEDPKAVLNTRDFSESIRSWMKNMKEAMLFLNNVSELKLFIIDERSSSMDCIFHFRSVIEEPSATNRALFQNSLTSFKRGREHKPCVIMYPLTLIEVGGGGGGKDTVEKWLIQQGVGDITNSDQVWQYIDTVKPRHGIAAPIVCGKKDFKGHVFCFLPLPVQTGLPVHVNGQFILSSNRRDLWRSTDSLFPDDRTKWNDSLVNALSSSYANFLLNSRARYVSEEYESIRTAVSHIEVYYNLFPNFTFHNSSQWNTLAHATYSAILKLNSPVLCVLRSCANSDSFSTEWFPPKSTSSASLVYYWPSYYYYTDKHKDVFPILERIGMKITPASSQIMECLNAAMKPQKPILSVTPISIFDYYTKYSDFRADAFTPTPIVDTAFQSIESFVVFTKYVMEEISEIPLLSSSIVKHSRFPEAPFSHFLLLTADGILKTFDRRKKVMKSVFFDLFPNSLGCFLHPSLLPVDYPQSCFINVHDGEILSDLSTNWVVQFIISLLEKNFPAKLKSTSVVSDYTAVISDENLRKLWKCLEEDRVFKKYLFNILKQWAFLLSKDGRLFSLSSNILPILYSSLSDKAMHDLLVKIKMPFLNTEVVLSASETTCPSLRDGRRILSNLYYINHDAPLASLLVKRDFNVIIDYFWSHLRDVAYDAEVIRHLQSLPLFENIDGNYTSVLSKKAYIWPNDACSVAYQDWLAGFDEVFIKDSAKWSCLGTAQQLSIQCIHTEDLYIDYIFKHFHQMGSSDRYKHLKHIKDGLFQTYKSNSMLQLCDGEIYCRKQRAIRFIDSLTQLHCIADSKSSLRCVGDFCDHTIPIFNAFSRHFLFLPEEYRKKEEGWLSFFRKLKLKCSVKKFEFENFCHETASGDVADIKNCSQVLLDYLFTVKHNWDVSMISTIAFVQQIELSHLTWVKERACPIDQMVSLNGSAPVSQAQLIWTVKPVVELPYCDDDELLDKLDVITKPSVSDVTANVKNICDSVYSDACLFSNYPNNCISSNNQNSLLSILCWNLHHLDSLMPLPTQVIDKLKSFPCIPVYHTIAESSVSDSQMVLVKPGSVINTSQARVKEEVMKFHPFLHCMPDKLQSITKLFEAIGVCSHLDFSHVQIALESIFNATEDHELDPNSERCVKHAIHSLCDLLKFPSNSDEAGLKLSPLYLPNSENVLKNSKNLLYADIASYRGIQLDLKDLRYSQFTITSAEYRHSALDVCRDLPDSVRPIALSTVCRQEVLDDQSNVARPTRLAEELESTFSIPEIPDAVISLIDVLVRKLDNSSDVKDFVGDYLSRIRIVTVVKVKYKIILKENNSCIGIHDKKRFCYVHGENESKLYLSAELHHSSDVVSSVASHLCKRLCEQISEINSEQVDELLKGIKFCFSAKTTQELQDVLNDEFGIDLKGEVKQTTFSKRLGEEIPRCWHHRLDQDLYNVFNPMEYVGYEDREGHIIVAQVVYPIKLEEGQQDLDKEYRIYVRKDDEDGRVVSILKLFKFLVGDKKPKLTAMPNAESDDQAVTSFDADNQIPIIRARLIKQNYADIKKSICDQLRAIWKLPLHLRKAAMKRLFLKWHPDKNHDDPDKAEEIFKFLMKQIEHLEKSEPLDDPDCNDIPQSPGYHYYRRSRNYGRYRYQWNYQSSNFDFHSWNRTAHEHYSFTEHESKYSDSETSFSQGTSSFHASFFPFDRKSESGKAEGKRWVRQAEVDFKVLCDIYSTADASNSYGHVCFMAHQVAEKALKGGVYALCGMDGRGLIDHNLKRHALSLEAKCPGSTADLASNASQLEDYYLDTRYPNRWRNSNDIPSDHYDMNSATDARKYSEAVLQTVKSIMP